MERDERWTAELSLLVVCLIWGCNFAIMKSALDDLHPFAFNTIRLSISAVFLAVVHYHSGGHRRPLPPGSFIRILGLSLIGYFGYQMLFLTGLQRTESGNSALILASAPIFTALVGFSLGERLRRKAFGGLLVAFGGTILIALEKDIDLGSRRMVGNLLTLGAACAWGSYTALNRGIAQRLPAGTLAFYTTAVTLPLHWIVGYPELGPLWSLQISAATWGAILYSGLLGTGFAYILWNVGLKGMGSAHTAGFVSVVPVVALVAGWWLLDESVSIIQVVGGACVLGGIWTMRSSRMQPRVPPGVVDISSSDR